MAPRLAENLRPILFSAAICFLAVFVFLLAYFYDNKYTVQQPHAANGVLILDSEELVGNPVLFLIQGWEYYGGKLLAPGDFSKPVPCEYIFIGQYGGFEAGNRDLPPHGSATYRLNIIVPGQEREYMLELPEIFSAYRAYINGTEVMRMGDPDPASYRPETGSRIVTFTAADRIEIIIAATDFSHMYSGMTYPPAFGDPESVTNLIGVRLVLRGVVCAVALVIALLSLLIGLLGRSGRLSVFYALLCLAFVGFVSYPLINTFTGGLRLFFAIENFSFCAVLLLAMVIQYRTNGLPDKWSRWFFGFGLFCAIVAAVLPFTNYLGSLAVLYGYSRLIFAYTIIAAVYLTFMAVRAIAKKAAPGLTMFGGILILNCALVMDRLLPLYEPIRTGWFIEIASFALILAIGVVIAQDVAAKYRENAAITERTNSMERLAGMQQGYYAVLRQEMEETRAVRHDLRHHFTVMKGLLQGKKYDELTDYINEYHTPASSGGPETYTDNNVINILIHHYNVLCGQNGIRFGIRCEITGPLRVSDADLCGALSNLLENAVEACLRIETGPRVIDLGLMNLGDALVIRVENSTDSNVKKSGGGFMSSKGRDRTGYGLASVHAIAKRYDGIATFSWDAEKRRFTGVVSM